MSIMIQTVLHLIVVLYLTSECDGGFYGQNCSEVCGYCFRKDQCQFMNGTCFKGCDGGYWGERCTKSKRKKKIHKTMFLFKSWKIII